MNADTHSYARLQHFTQLFKPANRKSKHALMCPSVCGYRHPQLRGRMF